MQEPVAGPEARYGTRTGRPRPAVVAAVVVVATLFVGWVVWAALGAASPEAGADVTAFRVVSDEEIEVRVTAAPGSSGGFGCSVRALGPTREVVGVASVTLHTGREGRSEQWLTVRTRDRAVTATVGRCSSGD